MTEVDSTPPAELDTRSRSVALASLLLLAAVGCGSEVRDLRGNIVASGCRHTLDGVCIGADTRIGELEGPCPCDGPSTTISDPAAIGSGCHVLAPGSYGDVTVPPGAQLIGNDASVGRLTLSGNASACNLDITAGVEVVGESAELKYALITSPDLGVVATSGSVTITGTSILGAESYGVVSQSGGSVDLRSVVVAEAEGAGIWMGCGCDCATTFSAERVLVSDLRLVGLALDGAVADLDRMRIEQIRPSSSFADGQGVAAFGCADVSANAMHIDTTADAGIFVFLSTFAGTELSVTRALRGMSVQEGADVSIAGFVASDNEAAGVVAAGGTTLALQRAAVSTTRTAPVPCLVNGVSAGSVSLGHGMLFAPGAALELTDVTLADNELAPLVIAREASGSLIDVTSEGDDAMAGLHVVKYLGGPLPSTAGATPALILHDDEPVAGECGAE